MGGWDDGSTTKKALAALSVQADDLEIGDQVLGLWPDNWRPVQVFRRMLTQWDIGAFGGYIRLRYESLPIVLQACAVADEDVGETMDCLQLMERHALPLLNARG